MRNAPFRWRNLSSDVIHAAELLEMTTVCGCGMMPKPAAPGEPVQRYYEPVEKDTPVTCLNCKNVLMTDEERDQRRQFRREHLASLAS